MSTEYPITLEGDVELCERSGKVHFAMACDGGFLVSAWLTPEELRLSIIRQIEVLSYVSADPDEALRRFNVKYGDES